MPNETLAFIVSFIAMVLVASSYFFKQKKLYLAFQASGIVFLILSYLFTGEYFAMIGLSIGLARTLLFFDYERRNKSAPIGLAFFFAGVTLAAYFIVDFGILGRAKPLDILYLSALVLYAFVFRMRDLKRLRFAVLAPTSLSVLYNILSGAVPFVIVSYSFELGANIVSIFKYHVFHKKNKTQSVSKESTYEKN